MRTQPLLLPLEVGAGLEGTRRVEAAVHEDLYTTPTVSNGSHRAPLPVRNGDILQGAVAVL